MQRLDIIILVVVMVVSSPVLLLLLLCLCKGLNPFVLLQLILAATLLRGRRKSRQRQQRARGWRGDLEHSLQEARPDEASVRISAPPPAYLANDHDHPNDR